MYGSERSCRDSHPYDLMSIGSLEFADPDTPADFVRFATRRSLSETQRNSFIRSVLCQQVPARDLAGPRPVGRPEEHGVDEQRMQLVQPDALLPPGWQRRNGDVGRQ